MTTSLQKIDGARKALAEAKSLDDILQIRDYAKAGEAYVRAAKLGIEAQNQAAELSRRAERKAGEFLRDMPKNPGAQQNIEHGGSMMEPPSDIPTLEKVGVDKKESHRWQLTASIPEEKFERWIEEEKERGYEITAIGLQRYAKKLQSIENYPRKIPENPTEVKFGYWALPRPLTRHWGSGDVWKRMCQEVGTPDVAFGVTDGIPSDIVAIDKNTGYEWNDLPFEDDMFNFGYWDPPYDKLYKSEAQEIWRTCRMLAVLHTHIYPRSWLYGAGRCGMYAITMGPMKQIRCLQIFAKVNA